jgi:serine O-acetyltransferase
MTNPILLYRLSNLLKGKGFNVLSKVITFLIRFIYSCYLPGGTKIGDGFVLGYGGLSVVIHERVEIGSDCHIDQCVTIGGTSKKNKVPKLGNSVYVGAGAKILGPIIIGNDVVIGANSVVISDVPDNCLVVGVPAKIIKEGIKKKDYV